MLRKILGVIAGYIALMIVTFIALTVWYNVLGADGVFGPANFEPTIAWSAGALIVSFLAALSGGYVSVLVGKAPVTAKILAGIVLVLGLIVGAMIIMGPVKNEVRPAIISMFEAIGKIKEPAWVCIVNPFVGAIGIMIGGMLKK